MQRSSDDERLYPITTIVAVVAFVLMMIGLVMFFRWLGGGRDATQSLDVLAGGR